MFDLEKFKTGNYYVHLPTQEIYDEVMEFLDDNGITWITGTKTTKRTSEYLDNHWRSSKENTAISYAFKNNEEKNEGIVVAREDNYQRRGAKKLFLMKKPSIMMRLEDGFQLKTSGEIVYQQKNEQEYTKLMFENRKIYLDKNKKYGDAFTDTIKKYGYISAITRMNDKFNRIEQFTLNGFKDEEESLRDSLMDLANYCYMYVMEIDKEKDGKNE